MSPRSIRQWLLPLQYFLLQRLREATIGLPDIAPEQLYDRLRKSDIGGRIQHLLLAQAARHHQQRHVPDHLRSRRDLDDVSEHHIDVSVGLSHFRPARVIDPQGAGLLAQVRVLPSGHAMYIYFRSAGTDVAFKRAIQPARLLPVGGQQANLRRIDSRITWSKAQSL